MSTTQSGFSWTRHAKTFLSFGSPPGGSASITDRFAAAGILREAFGHAFAVKVMTLTSMPWRENGTNDARMVVPVLATILQNAGAKIHDSLFQFSSYRTTDHRELTAIDLPGRSRVQIEAVSDLWDLVKHEGVWSYFSGAFPDRRTLTTLLSTSYQNGAPSESASAVKIRPVSLLNTSCVEKSLSPLP